MRGFPRQVAGSIVIRESKVSIIPAVTVAARYLAQFSTVRPGIGQKSRPLAVWLPEKRVPAGELFFDAQGP
jgi:hypothetical protein